MTPLPPKSDVQAPPVAVDELSKRYDGDVLAVQSISFTVTAGKTVGLLGGNGAGKTTTIAMLLGLLLPTSGTIRIFGEDMVRHRSRALPRMNFSSPYVDLPRRLTVRENLSVYANLYGLDRIGERIDEVVETMDLGQLLKRSTGALSSGQKTRVALAKALINKPDLLLLDEPTASLDPDTGDVIRGHLERYRAESGATIVLASHNMAEVERLCHEVLMMKQGRIVDTGAPRAMIDRYGRQNLEEVFLHIARRREDATEL